MEPSVKHGKLIALLERLNTDANPASRDRSYEAFVTISERESDLLKSQIRSIG